MQTKIIIVGSDEAKLLNIAKQTVALDDSLNIGEIITNDNKFKNLVNDSYIQYISTTDILLAFKNNAMLCIKTNDNISYGISNDAFYNNDIFIMDYELFNNISTSFLKSKDILIVWYDTKKYTEAVKRKKDLGEIKYLEDTLNSLPSLYYIDEDYTTIAKDIISYLNTDIDGKYKIIDENN